MAFENYALYSHFSVYDNIAFPLRSLKGQKNFLPRKNGKGLRKSLPSSESRNCSAESRSNSVAVKNSGVSLARTMVRRPQVYLLDEPIAHLDAKLRASARATLKQLAKEFGITIIYVTHNYREALALSDRMMVIRRGVIQQIDVPENIYLKPINDFTAKLIGDPPVN